MLQSVVLGIDWFVPCQLGLSFPHIGKSSYVEVLWHSDNPKVAGFVPSLVSPYIGMKK